MQPGVTEDHTVQIAVPSVLLAALGLVIWLAAFTGVKPDTARLIIPDGLEAQAEGEINGVEAAGIALNLARNAVPNASPDDDGLLLDPPVSVSARYEPLGSASSWTVVIRGPIRSRPNTDEEFRIDDGMIVIELSVLSGEVSGAFSAGRAFTTPDSQGDGVLRSLGIPPEGFSEVPLSYVWPPVTE